MKKRRKRWREKPKSRTVEDVINFLVREGWIRRILNCFKLNVNPEINAELKKDFEQELYLILLCKSPDKIVEMFNRDIYEVYKYLYTITRTQLYGSRQTLHKKYIEYYTKKSVLVESIWDNIGTNTTRLLTAQRYSERY